MKTKISLKQLKRIVWESIYGNDYKPEDMIFEDKYFTFIHTSGIGTSNTPWSGLKIVSKDLAKKHVVDIELHIANNPNFDGEPVVYEYRDCYVNHGNRMMMDTLAETKEYITVLQDAVVFAERVNDYIKQENLNALKDAFDREFEEPETEEPDFEDPDSEPIKIDEDMFDDPNPSSKRCPDCGAPMRYDKSNMEYHCSRCPHYERGMSRCGGWRR